MRDVMVDGEMVVEEMGYDRYLISYFKPLNYSCYSPTILIIQIKQDDKQLVKYQISINQ